MKKPYLILFLVAFINLGWISKIDSAVVFKTNSKVFSKIKLNKKPSKHQQSVFYKLTVEDRKNYVLSIDQSKIEKPNDIVINGTKYALMYVHVWLSNKSKYNLSYLIMTCSWFDLFQINNAKLSVFQGPCDQNFPVNHVLPSHKSEMFNLPVVLIKVIPNTKGDKFRVGMNVFKSSKKDQSFVFDSPDKYKSVNLIWSNEVKIP